MRRAAELSLLPVPAACFACSRWQTILNKITGKTERNECSGTPVTPVLYCGVCWAVVSSEEFGGGIDEMENSAGTGDTDDTGDTGSPDETHTDSTDITDCNEKHGITDSPGNPGMTDQSDSTGNPGMTDQSDSTGNPGMTDQSDSTGNTDITD
ncbi:hypothetical protein METBIDRAFT_229405 [Metschnikowia bicuspidata var. bicuspidata NRRL YB-4993]|uniref:Uncharacterized protein n=1 Tax=Metschnikowia bicuspidata var. bicuspidata NRRL YB-4993 TaxID=869754 RepID=A0A1A0HEX0_9ASCO|nr:hypothetical protein METBIDRAFT_229405 [Metschnikowia bicuspidata var. bicuspidata NRRL YB-4993]OBA22546.1 hypothetical protein METBIDRAFT_229405 [Metschnikowia bicuspidata var. bicuspidata NRRL YB-4993]